MEIGKICSNSMMHLVRYVPFTSFPIIAWAYPEKFKEIEIVSYGQPSFKKHLAALITLKIINSSLYINHWVTICNR